MRSRTRRVIAFAVGIAASSSVIGQPDPPSTNAIPGATELVFFSNANGELTVQRDTCCLVAGQSQFCPAGQPATCLPS